MQNLFKKKKSLYNLQNATIKNVLVFNTKIIKNQNKIFELCFFPCLFILALAGLLYFFLVPNLPLNLVVVLVINRTVLTTEKAAVNLPE